LVEHGDGPYPQFVQGEEGDAEVQVVAYWAVLDRCLGDAMSEAWAGWARPVDRPIIRAWQGNRHGTKARAAVPDLALGHLGAIEALTDARCALAFTIGRELSDGTRPGQAEVVIQVT
jgi:hypothetical protein